MSLVQSLIDVVFKGYLPYLAPILLFLMAIFFADRFVDLIYKAFSGSESNRRGSY